MPYSKQKKKKKKKFSQTWANNLQTELNRSQKVKILISQKSKIPELVSLYTFRYLPLTTESQVIVIGNGVYPAGPTYVAHKVPEYSSISDIASPTINLMLSNLFTETRYGRCTVNQLLAMHGPHSLVRIGPGCDGGA